MFQGAHVEFNAYHIMVWCTYKHCKYLFRVTLHAEIVCLLRASGQLIGHKVVGVRMVLQDGVSHSVDSSENAFKAAGFGAMKTCES